MSSEALTEEDIGSKFFTPGLVGANADKGEAMAQVREEAYFTKGRVIFRDAAYI
jgi:type I restriction enzyme R subunit